MEMGDLDDLAVLILSTTIKQYLLPVTANRTLCKNFDVKS
jgi:hypothetical protein